MQVGSKVTVEIPMMPGRRFPGVIVRKGRRPGIWRVRYETFGASYTSEFFEHRLEMGE